jgi:uncharacterized membrane protein HdeD (DUF308 family)
MTIREDLKKQAQHVWLAARIGIPLLCLGIVALVYPHVSWQIRRAVQLAVLLLAVGIFYVMQKKQLKCPRCNASLTAKGGAMAFGEGINRCLHCGANFDEPKLP